MLKRMYALGVNYPYMVIVSVVIITVILAAQLGNMRWETDARVYLPKGHPAIIYDEKVDDIFGVKDAVIIGIVNEEEGIFNYDTLAKIKRVTEKVAALKGVLAIRPVDVASLSTATVFTGNETHIGAMPIMESLPQSEADMDAIRQRLFDNADLFVGNIVSADGKAAMIRAKLKEGIANRYLTYFQIKGILAAESGEAMPWGNAKQWGMSSEKWQGNQWTTPDQNVNDTSSQPVPNMTENTSHQWPSSTAIPDQASQTKPNYDKFYLAGRPVIEVSSGLYAMDDLKLMVPLSISVMGIVLLIIFRTLRGMLLPLLVMGTAITWTLGTMVAFDVPMFTISTMLPVILVAVGIGDAVHLLSAYYDNVLENPHQASKQIVQQTLQRLGPPLMTTTLTTAIGFLALLFAEMPPFKIFGLFAVVGILYSWLISVTLLPALLTLLKPKVGSYLERRRSIRLYNEQSRLAWILTRLGTLINHHRKMAVVMVGVTILVMSIGASRLFVDSSWLGDFRDDSEVAVSTAMLNEKFSGTIFLNIIIEADQKNALKNPVLLQKMEQLQTFVESQPYVGDSISVVNFLRSMNKALHAGDPKYDVLPDTQAQIAEYLYLFSVSGRPQQLDEVVDYDYQKGLISVTIKTDHTKELKRIIDAVNGFVAREFTDLTVDVNFAGSANNSYIWAELLIDSQATAILFSKIGILIMASIILASLIAGIYVVVPVALSTLIIAGGSGLLRIPLDVSTALAAGIAIGVGVDYAVHYIFRYLNERHAQQDHETATAITLRTSGRTIVHNAIVVTAGFSVLFFSQFPPHVKLGYFVTAYMVVSCFIAIIVLPALFAYFSPRFAEQKNA